MTKLYVVFIVNDKRAILDFTVTVVTVIDHLKWTGRGHVFPKDSKNNNRTLICVCDTAINFSKNDLTFSFNHIILQEVQLPITINELQAVSGVGLYNGIASEVQDTSNCVHIGANT